MNDKGNIKIIPIIINSSTKDNPADDSKNSNIKLDVEGKTISINLSKDNISLNIDGKDINIPTFN